MWLLGAVSALFAAALLGGIGAWWLSGGRPRGTRQRSLSGLDAQAALWRHPAGRGRWPDHDKLISPHWEGPSPARGPTGPEDDPDFISALERLIRGEPGEHG